MINLPLFKLGIKKSWKLLLLFIGLITMYFTIIVTMFDPELGSVLNEFAAAMPELMALFGMTVSDTSMLGFMSSYLYGFIMLIFPMILIIILSNTLVAQKTDSGSLTYLVSSPVKRKTVILTQMLVLIVNISFLVLYATLIGIIVTELMFAGSLEIGKYLLLNLGTLAFQLFLGGICFFSSTLFNETKNSLAFGAGIPSVMFVLQMLANSGEQAEFAIYLTVFSLFNPSGIIALETWAVINIAIMFVAAAILYVFSVVVFKKKDLHI